MITNIRNYSEENEQYFFGRKIIAFLDILGFRDLVNYNDHSELLKIYRSLVENPVKINNELALHSKKLHEEGRYGDHKFSGLRMINVSDSIIVWVDNSRENSLLALLYQVKSLMAVAMVMGIPLRGSITTGDFDVIESNGTISIVGKALVTAYENEKKQQWSGCLVDDEVFKKLREYGNIFMGNSSLVVTDRNPHLLVKYDAIPLTKSGENVHESGYVVNWTMHDFLNEEIIRKSFEAYNKKVDERVLAKVENTLKFFRFCKETIKPPAR